ncbi:unnamed protein product [Peronospora belbahrii]|uniref:DUF4048 domain-containing protein n=1 Tax=Peronospora belbahrii TaxID=622444 RepID=A0AAU9L3H9_9STRA|nr:unnamed protein product [Peronospora belbahrii]CAH0513411.1 unnamed protein product [Peronospora belbahrii]
MLELELQALKMELQSTLAHLGIVCVSSDNDVKTRHHVDNSSVAVTAEMNDTQRNWNCQQQAQTTSDRNRSITQWNRRRLTKELSAVSARRREIEMQLQREIERERQVQDQNQQQQDKRRSSRKSVWQAAILELKQQRAQILKQIERETVSDVAEAEEREETRQSDVQETEERNRNQIPLPTIPRPLQMVRSNNETQYSIGGVVTLEPLSLSQQTQVSVMTTGVSLHPTVDVCSVATQVRDSHPKVNYRSTPDAINDVFLLQLKFAETMSKLEKSVQIRDQLLQHDRTSCLPKRRTRTQLINETRQAHRRSRHRKQSNRSEASSDLSIMYQENCSDDSFSSSSDSFSSLDSTPHRDHNVRVGYPNFGVLRATTAKTLARSTLGLNGESLTTEEATDRVCTVSGSVTAQSFHGLRENDRNSGIEHTPSDEQGSEVRRTPTTESSAATPTTGSDQKSNSSLSKQVRFGDEAYSTPVLARKFNFDGPSIDEDDYEEKDEEAGSVLSFLGGSSVTSSELNDVSFLRAFERFRRELNATQSSLQLPLARRLFSETNVSTTITATNSAPHAFDSSGEAHACDNTPAFPSLDDLSIEELQMRRRQLCLDIQAESAQLVLNCGGGMQNGTAGSQDAKQTQNCLQKMRDELKAVDLRLKSRV